MRSPRTAKDDQPGPTGRRHSSTGGDVVQSVSIRTPRTTPSRSGPRKPGQPIRVPWMSALAREPAAAGLGAVPSAAVRPRGSFRDALRSLRPAPREGRDVIAADPFGPHQRPSAAGKGGWLRPTIARRRPSGRRRLATTADDESEAQDGNGVQRRPRMAPSTRVAGTSRRHRGNHQDNARQGGRPRVRG